MYTNPTKHEYRPVANLTNAVVELPKDYTAGITFYVNAALVDLVTAVRKSRPGWRYKVNLATASFNTPGNRTYNRLAVFDGDEFIGAIWIDSRYDAGNMVPVYCVTNERIDRTLARKRHVESKKLQVAAKHMVKSFYAKTVDERIREHARPAFHAASGAAARLIGADAASRRELHDAAIAFALANEDAFLAGAKQVDRERFLKVKAFRQEEADVTRFRDGDKLVFMEQGNGKYLRALVRQTGDIDSSDEVTLDQLPEHQKLSLSILKLQDADAARFIAGHGVRVDETTFVTGA